MRLPTYQELSKEQDQIYNLPLDQSYVVTGPPGTGKTVMALYRARMYRDDNQKCRIIMLSRLLSEYVSAAVDELGLKSEVTTYNSWVWNFYKSQYGEPPEQIEKYVFDWNAILPVVFGDMPDLGAKPNVVVDEGQDLPPGFYMTLPYLSQSITVFADDNQIIGEHNSTIDEIKSRSDIENHLSLVKNYRNTEEIATLSQNFYTGDKEKIPEIPDRRGRPPVVDCTKSIRGFTDFLVSYEEIYSDLTIGVFTETIDLQKRILGLIRGKTQNKVQFYRSGRRNQVDFGKSGICLVSYQSAKGLEFDVVFIPELQDVSLDPSDVAAAMKLYVLTSRARDELFLTYSGEEPPQLIEQIPDRLVERRD